LTSLSNPNATPKLPSSPGPTAQKESLNAFDSGKITSAIRASPKRFLTLMRHRRSNNREKKEKDRRPRPDVFGL
jgi:hypothetical protein